MVEDNEIKAEVSPFAIREGEIKVFDGKDSYVSMAQITSKINQGVITDIHFRILDYIKPDYVHVLSNGKIIKTGNYDLAKEIDKNGYGELEDE